MEQKYDVILYLLMETLKSNKLRIPLDDFDCFVAIDERKNGKLFSDQEHLEGIVFSLLSSQRPWKPILTNKLVIKNIFNNFEFQYVLEKESTYFEQEIRRIKCGNKSIHRQMSALPSIVSKLYYIKEKFGSLDLFIGSDTPMNIAKLVSSSKEYKIPELGLPLALEYLRNVGIDISKPDSQLCRLFGRKRLGFSEFDIATPDEVVCYIEKIAKKNDISQAELGTTFWLLCAKDYGNICSNNPKCDKCKLCVICNMK